MWDGTALGPVTKRGIRLHDSLAKGGIVMSTSHGTVWWSELMTRDVAAARRYYEDVCGWQFETMEMPEGEYHVANAHGHMIAGILDMSNRPELEGVPPHWFTYIAVDDIEAALDSARAAGGTVQRQPFNVPEVGTIAMVTDASGAALGLIVPVETWDPPETESGSLENVPV